MQPPRPSPRAAPAQAAAHASGSRWPTTALARDLAPGRVSARLPLRMSRGNRPGALSSAGYDATSARQPRGRLRCSVRAALPLPCRSGRRTRPRLGGGRYGVEVVREAGHRSPGTRGKEEAHTFFSLAREYPKHSPLHKGEGNRAVGQAARREPAEERDPLGQMRSVVERCPEIPEMLDAPPDPMRDPRL
jgi:hypothetical protein